jgi:hypothetical protein
VEPLERAPRGVELAADALEVAVALHAELADLGGHDQLRDG